MLPMHYLLRSQEGMKGKGAPGKGANSEHTGRQYYVVTTSHAISEPRLGTRHWGVFTVYGN